MYLQGALYCGRVPFQINEGQRVSIFFFTQIKNYHGAHKTVMEQMLESFRVIRKVHMWAVASKDGKLQTLQGFLKE